MQNIEQLQEKWLSSQARPGSVHDVNIPFDYSDTIIISGGHTQEVSSDTGTSCNSNTTYCSSAVSRYIRGKWLLKTNWDYQWNWFDILHFNSNNDCLVQYCTDLEIYFIKATLEALTS